MINTVNIVGKLYSQPENVVTKDNCQTKWVKFIVLVERPFKNHKNEYENDFITIKTWSINTEKIKNKLIIDNIICIKGRIQSFGSTNINGHPIELIAEKIIAL